MLMKPHIDMKTKVYMNTLSTGTILRELTVWGGKARTKTAHMGPENLLEHWNDSFPRSVLSQTEHCRAPENVPGTN